MRRFMKLGFMVALVGLIGLSSCDDNEEIIPTDPDAEYDAVLELSEGGGNENVNVSVDANTQANINAKVSFTSTDASMRRLYITQNIGGQGDEPYEITQADTKGDGSINVEASNSSGFEYALPLQVPSGVQQGTVVYTFWTTTGRGDYRDIEKRLAVGVGTITLQYGGANPEAQVKSYTAKLLAAPLNDGSSETFISLLDGGTYRINQGEEYAAFWDFGYYYGATGEASLASTKNYPTDIIDVPAIAGTTELNNAYFAKSSVDFESVSVSGDLDFISASASERVNNLTVGQVIEFVDHYGKKGLIKIMDIVPGDGSNGEITIDIKVQP